MNMVIQNYGHDRPTARRGDWLVEIDGEGGIPGIGRHVYRFACKMMTPAIAIAAAVEMWELKHCPDPDAEGDIAEHWTIYGIECKPVDYLLTVDSDEPERHDPYEAKERDAREHR
jgi:hypothetical protein